MGRVHSLLSLESLLAPHIHEVADVSEGMHVDLDRGRRFWHQMETLSSHWIWNVNAKCV